MRDLDDVFAALSRSAFRQRFRIRPDDRAYALRRTRAVILEHGRDFIRRGVVANDGGIHVALADAARDDLRVLGTEVEDDDLLAHAKGEVFACGRKTWRGKSASHAREEGS